MEYLKLLEFNSDNLILHTGMNSKVFVQSNVQDKLHEKGYIASYDATMGWSFEPYQFNDTGVILHGNTDEITVIGKPFEGKLFIDYLETITSVPQKTTELENICTLLEQISNAIEASLKNDTVKIEANGPLSIVVANENKFLFLPSQMFQISLSSLSKTEIAEFAGCYQNKALANTTAELRFMLSCMLYRALTGTLPYPELDNDKRVEDYYDQNYIPLNLIFPLNLDDKALEVMNNNLSLRANIHYNQSKKKKPKKNQKEIITDTSQEFPKGSFIKIAQNYMTAANNIQDTAFNKECKKHLKRQNTIITRKRFFRKHGTSVAIITFIALFVLSIPLTIIHGNLKKPTTKNMSALQVVQTFYDGINTINAEKIESTGDKAAIKGYSNSISTIFVTQQMRVGYESVEPYFTPQQWLNTAKPVEYLPFGVTNLQIDTIEEPKTELIINNTQANLIEVTAQINDTAVFSCSYYYIHGNQKFNVIQKKETLYLTYSKHKFWQITNIDIDFEKNIAVNDAELQKDLQEAFDNSNPSTRGFEMSTQLREKYAWMPLPQAVMDAKDQVLQYIEPEAR